MVDGSDQARAFAKAHGPNGVDAKPDGPGVPRGRATPDGDGGGPRELSQDGTKPIGGRKNHPGSPPYGSGQ